MADYGFIVPPRSRKEIRQIAGQVRSIFGVTTAMVDIVRMVELKLPTIDDGFVFQVAEQSELGDIHGLSNPVEKWIRIRKDVYEGAFAGKGRDRMTVAHELGHYFLHRRVDFPSLPPGGTIPSFRQSERQANTFAAELLIGFDFYEIDDTREDLVSRFGVSHEAARVQLQILKLDEDAN